MGHSANPILFFNLTAMPWLEMLGIWVLGASALRLTEITGKLIYLSRLSEYEDRQQKRSTRKYSFKPPRDYHRSVSDASERVRRIYGF